MPEDKNNISAESSPFFEARGVTKKFDSPTNLTVLDDVDLTLKRGEMISIIGASGTGKTTLLHILGALDRPSHGELLYHGKNVLTKNDADLSLFRNKTVGFVFQFHHLLPEFTAIENVMLPGFIAAKNQSEVLADANELLEKVEVGQRANHKVGELSGGEQQRVALARALIMKPALLLADEPTGNLDPKTGDKVFDLIRELNESLGLTTVMVTHNHDLARQMDRCLILADKKLMEHAH